MSSLRVLELGDALVCGPLLLSCHPSRPQHLIGFELGAILKLVATGNPVNIRELRAWMGPRPALCLASAQVRFNAGAVDTKESYRSSCNSFGLCVQKCDIAGELPIASMSKLQVLLLV